MSPGIAERLSGIFFFIYKFYEVVTTITYSVFEMVFLHYNCFYITVFND